MSVTNYIQATITSGGAKQFVPVGSSSTPSVTDSNGNQITISGSSFIDTTGNTALTIGGGAPNPQTFKYTDTNGNTQTVSMNYSTYTVETAFGCSGVTEYGANGTTQNSLVSSITFPDGSSYKFTYEATPGHSGNVTGRLSGVQLPQGDWIYYSYSGGNEGIECADGSTAGLTRTLNIDSGSASSTWTFTRSFPNGSGTSHTAVVDGLNNNLAYDFVQATGFTAEYLETNRSVYNGAATGTPVIARGTCYNAASYPCLKTAISLPLSQVDTYESINGSGLHGSTVTYNTSYGMPKENEVYDFGTSTSRASPPLRIENWTYGYSIPDLITEDEVFDGNNNEAGNTTYFYDQTTPTTSSGVPQHISVSGPRGNLTTVNQYASSSVEYTITATYEDTGSVLTVTTPNGTSALSYDSTFVYGTGVSLPTPSSGVALNASESFDTSYTGLPKTATDFNGQVTSDPSYDSMLRLTEALYPDEGKTLWSYTPTTVTADIYQTSNIYSTAETQVDGYDRLSRTVLSNGQSSDPWYQQDSCYDANGNVSFVSYAYQGTGLGESKVCSGAGTSYTYDVLGRVTSVTQSDSETRSYTYSERATQFTDENNVKRISQVDGLGRTTIVCEISSNNSMPGSGSTAGCGTDISGTGFATSYSYTLATPTTTITQGPQTRTFQTDWLGRTTSVTEPESGATTYSYAYNSTGLAVTRIRPKANQTSSSVTTTTTTQYDSVGRPVSVAYSDGTPTKSYSYDSSLGWGTISQTNMKGRVSLASISGTAGSAYSYDPMGRVNAMDECLPSGCGNGAYDRLLYYTYDLAGDLLTSTDGSTVQSTYNVSLAGELQSLTSSQNNSTNPPDILSNVQNGPHGPTSWSLGNGLSGVHGYDTLGRLNGGWVCNGSTSQSCTGGTQMYGFSLTMSGNQVHAPCDTTMPGTCMTVGYDEFSRLTSWGNSSLGFTYVYDRWGNRWQQNLTAGSGPQPQLSFNTSTNRVTNSGYSYDAAGNMTDDSVHAYTYDAEGNVTAVDSGSTATYTYDALNHRVQTVTSAGTVSFLFNANGQRVSTWSGAQGSQIEGQYYWGSSPVAFYESSATHFQHQDWVGTERIRTTYSGSLEGTFTSLPFGDDQTTVSGSDLDAYHYAMLDYDKETNTGHAQYRQYNSTQGHWVRPDPYYGSYDFSNPQSFDRYAYAGNSPLANVDPQGLESYPTCPPQSSAGCSEWDAENTAGYYDDYSTSAEATSVIWVSGGNGTYAYSSDIWSDMMQYGPGDGITIDADGTISCGGDSCGYVSYTLMMIGSTPTSGPGVAPNNAPTVSHCLGAAASAKGVSIGLDILGAIPVFGNGVSAGAGIVRAGIAVNHAIASPAFAVGSGIYGAYGGVTAGPGEATDSLVGSASAGAGIGLALADVSLAGTKAIPIVGNFVSVATLGWDGYQAYKTYQSCMAGH
jgi:RHS repeat-associated protein